jgi:AAA family ATP:ADP antiporter
MTSPYLLGICLFIFLYTIGSTFLYFEQARIVGAAIKSSAERTAFFARMDLYVNVLTVLGQAFLSSRIIPLVGLGATLAFLPVVTIIGFGVLSLWQTPAVIVAFQVIRRASEYTLVRPARETLFTVVSREEKYSSKSFIDTFVYRTGDLVGAWSDRLLAFFSLGAAGLAITFLPLAALWFATALFLGRRQKAMALGEAAGTPAEWRRAPA